MTEATRAQLWIDTRNSGPVITFKQVVPPVAQAAGAETILGTVPIDGVVTAVTYAPNDDITGADTNTRAVTLYNRGSDGEGTTDIATLQFDSGVDASEFVGKVITLSGTASDLDVSAGDVLSFASDEVASGLADPGGYVTVTVERS